MIDFDKYRKAVKAKPTVTRDHFYKTLNDIQMAMQKAEENVGRVINVGKVYKPETLEKYDVITSMVCGTIHPCVIYKVDDKFVYSVSLTTTEAAHNIHKFEHSRMFKGSYMTNNVIRMDIETAVAHFVGLFDNHAEADVAFAKALNFYKELFNI